jgi:hypothetical protein
MDIQRAYPSRQNPPFLRLICDEWRATASCEAHQGQELWKIPFVFSRRKFILTCRYKAVKAACGTGLQAPDRRRCATGRSRLRLRLLPPALLRYSFLWGRPMRSQVVCSICDKSEHDCLCEKYCTICKGQHNVRLCSDGLYYCPECREACDVSLAENRGH